MGRWRCSLHGPMETTCVTLGSVAAPMGFVTRPRGPRWGSSLGHKAAVYGRCVHEAATHLPLDKRLIRLTAREQLRMRPTVLDDALGENSNLTAIRSTTVRSHPRQSKVIRGHQSAEASTPGRHPSQSTDDARPLVQSGHSRRRQSHPARASLTPHQVRRSPRRAEGYVARRGALVRWLLAASARRSA